jgi:hypothetical protein
MPPVAGHFYFPEYAIPLVPYKGQKREAKQSIGCVMYGYGIKTTANSGCDMVSIMVVSFSCYDNLQDYGFECSQTYN